MTRQPDPALPQTNGSRSTDTDGSIAVGVFDSGVGGLSVLPALRLHLPRAQLIYMADSGHAPYGERDDDWLQARCVQVADFLKARGAQMLVMACNTATAAAAPALRARYPHWPIVGMEPGIKPAVARSPSGRVGVMATTATLRSQRYARLMAEHGAGAQIFAQACTGLAWAIEQGNEEQIQSMVDLHTSPLRQAQVDTVVLGCTHYAFARPWIEAALPPGVNIIDTADAVARRAASLALLLEPRRNSMAGEFWSSGEPARLEAFARRWLGWAIEARAFSAGSPKARAA